MRSDFDYLQDAVTNIALDEELRSTLREWIQSAKDAKASDLRNEEQLETLTRVSLDEIEGDSL